MNGRMDGWMDGWMGERMSNEVLIILHSLFSPSNFVLVQRGHHLSMFRMYPLQSEQIRDQNGMMYKEQGKKEKGKKRGKKRENPEKGARQEPA